MTKDTFEWANTLQKQMGQIQSTIDYMNKVDDFKLEPMTRQSNIYIRFGMYETDPIIHLSEGEAVCIKAALIAEKDRLQRIFDHL